MQDPATAPRAGDGAARGHRRRRLLLPLLGIVLVALNLRAAITSVGPVIADVRDDLGLSGTAVGLLTTAPLLAFGLVAPLGPPLARRIGAERALLGCLLALGGGLLLRVAPPVALLFLGTLIAGCAIAIANVLLPGLVKRRFPERAALMTGVYSLALGLGASIAAGLSVPVERWAGGSWRAALGVWAAPALLAAIAWAPAARRRAGPAEGDLAGGGSGARLWRDPLAWHVTALMAIQSLLFYTTIAWLPAIYRHEGASAGHAGALLSLAVTVGLPGSFLAALAIQRRPDQRPIAAVTVALTAAGFLGVLLAPTLAAPLWCVLLGLGMGGGFTLVLTLMVLRAASVRDAAELSGMAQSVGYTLAAVGPIAVGALHDLTGAWTLPLVLLTALTLPELFAALGASRPGHVGASRHTVGDASPPARGSAGAG